LRIWLKSKLAAAEERARRHGSPVPIQLNPDELLFRVPKQLFKILHRDLALAGIPIRDERGRVVDVHALRHTFATHLARAATPILGLEASPPIVLKGRRAM
jgi:integrase